MSKKKETKLDGSIVFFTIVMGLVWIGIFWFGCDQIVTSTSKIKDQHSMAVVTENEEALNPNTTTTEKYKVTRVGDICENIESDARHNRNIGWVGICFSTILFIVFYKFFKIKNYRETAEGAKESLEKELIRAAEEQNSNHTLCDLLNENKFSEKILIRAAIRATLELRDTNLEAIVKLGPLDINTQVPIDYSSLHDKDSKGSLLHCITEYNYKIESSDAYIQIIERMLGLGIDLSTKDVTYDLTAYKMFSGRYLTSKNRMDNEGIAKVCELLKPAEAEETQE